MDRSSSTITTTQALLFLLPIAAHVLYERRQRRQSVAIDSSRIEVLQDGLVYIPHALSSALQHQLVTQILRHGHEDGKFWNSPNDDHRPLLNNHRQGRGRIYHTLESYHQPLLLEVCRSLSRCATLADPTMPLLEDPTHLLTLFYTTNRKLGWHSDNGPQDGQSPKPVVSVSLGDDCGFAMRLDDGSTRTLLLKSGDVVLFGGKSRWIWHSVTTIRLGTAPQELLETHQQLAPSFWNPPSPSFRINLTFRHAPELYGTENSDRFIYFAKSARSFVEKTRETNVKLAQQQVVEGRKARQEAKKRRKEERRAQEEQTGKKWWEGKK